MDIGILIAMGVAGILGFLSCIHLFKEEKTSPEYGGKNLPGVSDAHYNSALRKLCDMDAFEKKYGPGGIKSFQNKNTNE
jgi:hypothetical protein